MKRLFKNLLSFPCNSKLIFNLSENLLHRSSGGYILSFHDLSPETFETHVNSLKPSEPISLDELIKRYKSGKSIKNCFAITFDDGVEETVMGNWNICKKNNWPVTFYLPTDYLNGENLPYQKIQIIEKLLNKYHLPEKIKNKTQLLSKKNLIKYLTDMLYVKNHETINENINYFLKLISKNPEYKNKNLMPKAISWEKVKDISKNSLSSFQSHSVSHTACSSLSEKELKNEMLTSKKTIEDFTGRKVNSFCYPYGSKRSISDLSVQVASKYFETATTLIRGRLKNSNLHYLPRIDLYEEHPISFVRLKVALS
tara:strand:+ start:1962 stop:2897 length:936 start_codon:yes stop_codon:yes gene_type:complete